MDGTLLLAILSIRSSYARNIEETLGEGDVPDTLQWWISPLASWRIRTYAIDHDIHTHTLSGPHSNLLELARAQTLKHYGDIIIAQHEIEFADCTDQELVESALRKAGLTPHLEVAPGRFAFWKPDDARYHSQSVPK